MRGSFGDLSFGLVNSPIAFGVQQKTNYAEHPRAENKGVLQWTSHALDRVKLTMRFDYWHTNPAEQVAILQAMLLGHEPHLLITVSELGGTIYGMPYSGADVFQKEYVLESIDSTVKHTDKYGRLIYVDCACTLLECVQDMPAAVGGGGFGSVIGGGNFGGLGGLLGGILGF